MYLTYNEKNKLLEGDNNDKLFKCSTALKNSRKTISKTLSIIRQENWKSMDEDFEQNSLF